MKIKLLFVFVFVALFAGAQNLVPNPSFEDYYSCPNSTGQVDSCIGWHLIHKTPDYFAVCSPYPVTIPDNFVGYQMPFDGNCYMGIITYDWAFFWREIIGVQLLDSLVPGSNYHISMRVSRGNWTNQSYNCAASNKIGMRFTTQPYTVSDTPVINNYAQVYVDSIITDTLNWVLLSWNYIPDSVYKYLYIGNFFDNDHTDTTVINAPLGQFGIAYYFVDSVNVFCNDPNCIVSVNVPEKEKYSMIFNSSSKILEVMSDKDATSINIFTSSGQIVKNVVGDRQRLTLNLSNLSTGIYIIQLETTSESITKKISIY